MHGVDGCRPAAQMAQTLHVEISDCCTAFENVSVGHQAGVLDPLPQYAPTGHGSSGPETLGQKYLLGQRARDDDPAGQNAPGVEEHDVGADALAAQKLPAGHRVIAVLDMMELPMQYDPGRHCEGYEYDPGRHAHEAGVGEPALETEPLGH
ncbi:hypothetical protein JZU54_01485 [bacterium]|nr:hypothetical protein [bacterium]